MNIRQKSAFFNPLFVSTLGTSYSVPHIWHHKILRGGNKPDDVGITILSELLQLHLSSDTREREFQLGYAYFKAKFNYTCEQVYMALTRLGNSKLISKKEKSGKNINNLFITLNVENLLALHTESDNNPDEKKGELEKDSSTLDNSDTSLIKEISPSIDLYIDIKEDIEVKKENYISGSQFEGRPRADKNTTEGKIDSNKNPSTKTAGIIKTAKRWVKNLTRQPITSFHPLTEEDAEHLRLHSGREFNLNFINQLILRLGDKYPEHGFYTKKLFMKYMATLLANEMRQAINVNNESFRLKRTDDEAITEEYLARVEGDYGTKASDQIRKKVAASFEPAVAYKILTSCYFPEEAYEGRYEIKQRSSFELSESQRDRLYNQISAVFGDRARNIQITKNFKPVAKLPQTATPAASLEYHASDTTTLWGRVRSGLIASYGEAIDKSWFSKLEPTEDASSRSLILKGASFLTDYIQTNYSHVIERLCREENYQLKFC